MGNPKGPAHLINTSKNHFSHPRTGRFQIDIIINNAGVSKDLPLEEITSENFSWLYTGAPIPQYLSDISVCPNFHLGLDSLPSSSVVH